MRFFNFSFPWNKVLAAAAASSYGSNGCNSSYCRKPCVTWNPADDTLPFIFPRTISSLFLFPFDTFHPPFSFSTSPFSSIQQHECFNSLFFLFSQTYIHCNKHCVACFLPLFRSLLISVWFMFALSVSLFLRKESFFSCLTSSMKHTAKQGKERHEITENTSFCSNTSFSEPNTCTGAME